MPLKAPDNSLGLRGKEGIMQDKDVGNYKKMIRKVPNEWKLPDVSIINPREDFFLIFNFIGLKARRTAEKILDFFLGSISTVLLWYKCG